MSHTKQNGKDVRKSPINVTTQKSAKVRTPKAKVSKTAAAKPLNNGLHAVTNGVGTGRNSSGKSKAGGGEDEIAKINLLTLQKVDSAVSAILATVPHVVLYEYKTSGNMWERTPSEGTLFVYSKDQGSKEKGFMILNRLSSDNTRVAVSAGMEFCLQPPFILYGEDSGSIFGLCIQDQAHLTETAKLLNRLSTEAAPVFAIGGEGGSDTSGSSPSTPPTNGRRSNSPTSASTASTERHTHQQKKQFATKNGVDVLEMLEMAGRSYLGGQSFSDDTDSHDEMQPSPPKEGGMAPAGVGMASLGTSSHSVFNRTPVSKVHHTHSSPSMAPAANGHSQLISPRTTSPREIPKSQQGGVSHTPGHHQGQSPQKAGVNRAHNQQRKQTRSPDAKHSYTPSSTAPSSSPRGSKRGVVLHATSFDQSWPSRGLIEAPTHSGNRSNSLFGTTPHVMATTASQQFHSAHLPSRAYSAAAGSSTDNPIVRKLFRSQPDPSTSSMSYALQTLLSQAATPKSTPRLSSSAEGLHGVLTQQQQQHTPVGPPLVSALSLDEIEKQLTEDVPGTDPKTDYGVPKESNKTKVSSASSRSGPTVLLQPSAFVSSSSSPTISTIIAVEPPSPVVEPHLTTKPQVFPSIPPLMHSAGMTAPPLTPPLVALPPSTHDSSSRVQGQTNQSPLKGVASKEHISGAPLEFRVPPHHSVSTETATTSKSSLGELPVPGRSSTLPGTLMSPQQFSSQTREGTGTAPVKSKGLDIGLTKEQMQEALMYMIQNDHDFVDRLHNAYKMSLTKRLA